MPHKSHSFYNNNNDNNAAQESVGGCSSPSSRPWARKWRTTNVCDAWPVRRQTYGYLPSRNQIILLGELQRHMCVLTTCPGLHSTAGRPGFELATCWSQVQRPNHSATEPQPYGTTEIQLLLLLSVTASVVLMIVMLWKSTWSSVECRMRLAARITRGTYQLCHPVLTAPHSYCNCILQTSILSWPQRCFNCCFAIICLTVAFQNCLRWQSPLFKHVSRNCV